jgi:acyl carrier protein
MRGWDSMAHVRLILAIEERFGFQFSNRELGKMTNIGRMIDLIANKISNDAS